jgi:hypothetical protein
MRVNAKVVSVTLSLDEVSFTVINARMDYVVGGGGPEFMGLILSLDIPTQFTSITS